MLHIPPRTISSTTLFIATGGAPIAIYHTVLLFFYRMPYSCSAYCKQRAREPNRQYQRLQSCKDVLPCALQTVCVQRSRHTGEPFIYLHCILVINNFSSRRSSSAELSPQLLTCLEEIFRELTPVFLERHYFMCTVHVNPYSQLSSPRKLRRSVRVKYLLVFQFSFLDRY